MDFTNQYSKKKCSLNEAYDLVRPGMTIVFAGDCNCPLLFGGSFHTITGRLTDVTVFKDHTNYMQFVSDPASSGHVGAIGFFYGKDFMEGMQYRSCSYFPTDLCNYPTFILHHHKPDMFVAAATDMDENGNFQISLCNMWESDTLTYCIENGAKIILEANPNIPHVTGGFNVNIKDVACVIEADYKPRTIKSIDPSPDEIKVAQNVRSLLRDGDCVQFGIGSLPDAIAAQCMDLHDLGMHTEMVTTALGKMIREGVITGERKNLNKGEHIFTFAGGDEELYKTLGENKKCRIVPGSYGVNPMVIMQNDNMVSINTLIEIDLTSVTKKGDSKITSMLNPGAAVTVPRNYVDYIVTEYGIAPMRGRSVRERVNNLIAIAHPDFRKDLENAARNNMYI